jgi:hypothetical protein
MRQWQQLQLASIQAWPRISFECLTVSAAAHEHQLRPPWAQIGSVPPLGLAVGVGRMGADWVCAAVGAGRGRESKYCRCFPAVYASLWLSIWLYNDKKIYVP